MALHEFDLIREYFSAHQPGAAGLVLGVGDDCALFELPEDCQLAVTTDTLVADIHFPANGDPRQLGERCLRVNLSDLAAMGAQPLGFQLALTLPTASPDWLAAFSSGLLAAASRFQCPLSGGDTTRGPLAITITALGQVPKGQALRRSGARPGDSIYVSGVLGAARGALEVLAGRAGGIDDKTQQQLLTAYWQPEPMLAAGPALRVCASAALDISDGLLQDLGHIARASGVDAVLYRQQVPVSPALVELAGREQALDWALTGGDDYQLCFTVSPAREQALVTRLAEHGIEAVRVGDIIAGTGEARCLDDKGHAVSLKETGYAHF